MKFQLLFLFFISVSSPIWGQADFPKAYDVQELLDKNWRIGPRLKNHLSNGQKGENGLVSIAVKARNPEHFVKQLQAEFPSIKILNRYTSSFHLTLPRNILLKLLQLNEVTYAEVALTPKTETPVSLNDLTVNRINAVQSRFTDDIGEQISVSVKELLFNSNDIDLKNRFFFTGLEDTSLDQHANLIATVIAGAGNSSSIGLGVVPSAKLTSSSFLRLLPDEDDIFVNNNISVQNHSYGTEIENVYGIEAAAYDESAQILPNVVHVFSSGNSGNEVSPNGPYAGLVGFSNQTGNFKAAKNIITVGAVDATGKIEERSSKGPAFDGRIKPEMVAYAPGGTSDAAALVSGTAALLQDAYLQREGELPTAAMVRALMYSGCDDVGAAGIDFESGYGNLNALKSIEILDAGHYFNGTLSRDQPQQLNIEVPVGIAELKLVINWTDLPANPGDEIALVNDIDSSISDSTGNIWTPWVLNTEPTIDALTALQVRGQDHLNTTEVITIDNPEAGIYTVAVTGSLISNEQSYAVAYGLKREAFFEWTHPLFDSPLVSNQENVLRWENSFVNTTGLLELNLNNSWWTVLGDNVNLQEGFEWNGGDMAGTAQLRMTIDGTTFTSEEFSISEELLPQVNYNCDDEVMLSWSLVPNAEEYAVRVLGDEIMELFETVTENSIVLPKQALESSIVSVQPIFENSLLGIRGRAIDFEVQGVSCFFRNFNAALINDERVACTLNLSTELGISQVIFEKTVKDETQVIASISAPFVDLELVVEDENFIAGDNAYSALIILEDGTQITTETVNIFLPEADSLVLYPNPLQNGDDLNIFSAGEPLNFEIANLSGQVVAQGEILSFNDVIELQLATGIYVFQVVLDGKKVVSRKLIVN